MKRRRLEVSPDQTVSIIEDGEGIVLTSAHVTESVDLTKEEFWQLKGLVDKDERDKVKEIIKERKK